MTKLEELKAAAEAAQARIDAIPFGETIISNISDDFWLDESVAEWMINIGSDKTGHSEELDDCDKAPREPVEDEGNPLV